MGLNASLGATAAALGSLLLVGCATPPVISDISDSSVKVQAGLGTPVDAVDSEAARGCGIYDKKPERLSFRCLDEYCFRKEYLFACR